jgi:hypothetical protein
MTYETALKHSGIKVTGKLYENLDDDFFGETRNGNKFYLRRNCHNNNEYWVLDINGKTVTTRCCFRTALKKIKAN